MTDAVARPRRRGKNKMRCPECGSDMPVHHTIVAEGVGRVGDAICSGCLKRWTLVTVVFSEVTGRGTGAEAVAKRLERLGRRKVIQVPD